jgi:hypothetical protein
LQIYDRVLCKDEIRKQNRMWVVDDIRNYNSLCGVAPILKEKFSKTSKSFVPHAKNSTIYDVIMNEKNPLGIKNRHLFPSSVTFTKNVASPNYECSSTGVWSKTGNVTTLYTYKFGPFSIPLICSETSWKNSGLPLEDVVFYFDNKNDQIKNGTDPATGVIGVVEPSTQSLNVVLTFSKLETTLHTDELTKFANSHTSFFNLTKLNISKNMTGDKKKLIRSVLPYENVCSTVQQGGTSIAKNYPQLKDITFSIKKSEPYVKLKSSVIPLEIRPAKISTVCYFKKEVNGPFNKSSNIGNGWVEGQTYTFKMNTLPFTTIPHSTLFFVSCRGDDFSSQVNAGCQFAKIKRITAKLDSNEPFMQSFTDREFYNATKKYAQNYTLDNHEGCFIQGVVNEVDGTYINGTLATFAEQQKGLVYDQTGSFVLLKWGEDIPLPSSLAASVDGLSSNMTYEFTVEGPKGETGNICNVYIVNFFEQQIQILPDHTCTTKTSLFRRTDITNAYAEWMSKVNSNQLYVNSSNVRGGGILDVARKVGSYLPKIYQTIKKGIDFYNNNKETINTVTDTSKSLYDQAKKEFAGGKMSLEDYVKSIKK